ncbi:MAG: hypothetical protein R3C19_24815 [Planctomycetaceae bacterium]
MRGFLDDNNAAFLTVDFGQGPMHFQIDTGFDGALAVGDGLFDPSKTLGHAGDVIADLAASQVFRYDAWFVEFVWMEEETRTRVLVAPGTDCLIGTALLTPLRLEIDYEQRTVELMRGKSW